MTRRISGARGAAGAAALAAALLLAACGGGDASDPGTPSTENKAVASDPTAEIVVWTDGVREPVVRAYMKAHPDAKVKVVTVPQDSGYVSTKVQLANRVKSGWPDVVWLSDPPEIASLATAPYDFAQPLDELVPDSVRNDFAPGTLANCTFDGKTYCLQNDIAQTVLWYNAKLMKDFGYAVPTTWEEYAALGKKVAAEHPGYVIGNMGDHNMMIAYYQASGCPMREATAGNKVRINVTDPSCTRVNDMVQSLIDNGTAPKVSIFDPPFAKLGTENKILMLPGASWMGDFVFKTTYKTPAGQLAAAPIPKWEGEDAGYSGTVGGGIWVVSKHAKNVKGAADAITWMTTDLGIQNQQPTYPANKTAAASWSTNKKADPFYAENPIPVFEKQAGLIRQNWKFVRYASVATNQWNELVIAGLKDGKKLSELVPAYGEELKKAAEKAGYTVE